MYKKNYFTIARPYAKAVFDFSIETNSIHYWKKTLEHLSEIIKHKEVKMILNSSLLPLDIIKIFHDLCIEVLNEYVINFLRLITKNKRLQIIPYILKHFIKLYTQYHKIEEVKIVSSVKLHEKQLLKIKKYLESTLLCHVNIHENIDQTIISGLIIYSKNMVIDASIKTRLKNLMNILKS